VKSMRINPQNHIRALAAIALALLATSCSRSLPTAPMNSAPAREDGAADPFAVAGLENQVVVTLAPGVSAKTLAAQYGAIVVKNDDGRTVSVRSVTGQAPGTLMSQLALDPRIQTSEPNTWLEPAEARQQSFAFDDGFGTERAYAEQPAAAALGVDYAHQVARGRGVKVAILDTGIDPRHPLLRESIASGWDFVQNDADPTDQKDFIDNDRDGAVDEAYGHGTHVAGIVHLVAPDAQLMIGRVLDADGRGDIVDVTAGVRWAVAYGAKVINLSLGKPMVLNSRDAVEALQEALGEAEAAGVIVVSSAGNNAVASPDFPAISSHAFGIGATDASGNAAPFSNFDGSELLLSAPGIGIRSCFPGDGYKLWSGTSMSAPWVAGTAALLAEKHPSWTMDIMKTRLKSSVTPITSTLTAPSEFGAGMLNIAKALAPDWPTSPELPDQPLSPDIVPIHP
jgi:subtilisin family serine protease